MKTPITAPTRLSRLIQLNARTSELMEFMDRETFKQRFGRYPEEAYNETVDPDQVRSQRKVIGATAAGAGLVGAGFIGQRAINKAGGYGAVAKKATDAGARTVDYAGKIGTELKYARNLGGALRSGPLDIAKDFLKRARGVRFASLENIVRLNTILDDLLQFRSRDEDESRIGNAARGAVKGGVIGGLGLGGVTGGVAAIPSAAELRSPVNKIVQNMTRVSRGAGERSSAAHAARVGRRIGSSRLVRGGLYGGIAGAAGLTAGALVGSSIGAARKPKRNVRA